VIADVKPSGVRFIERATNRYTAPRDKGSIVDNEKALHLFAAAEHEVHLPGRDSSHGNKKLASNEKRIAWPVQVLRRVRQATSGSSTLQEVPFDGVPGPAVSSPGRSGDFIRTTTSVRSGVKVVWIASNLSLL